jgi:hypothetical protein
VGGGAYMVFWVVVSSTERVVSSDATAKWPAVCGEKRTARTLGEECETRGRCQGGRQRRATRGGRE